jgi:hypothetical protein
LSTHPSENTINNTYLGNSNRQNIGNTSPFKLNTDITNNVNNTFINYKDENLPTVWTRDTHNNIVDISYRH